MWDKCTDLSPHSAPEAGLPTMANEQSISLRCLWMRLWYVSDDLSTLKWLDDIPEIEHFPTYDQHIESVTHCNIPYVQRSRRKCPHYGSGYGVWSGGSGHHRSAVRIPSITPLCAIQYCERKKERRGRKCVIEQNRKNFNIWQLFFSYDWSRFLNSKLTKLKIIPHDDHDNGKPLKREPLRAFYLTSGLLIIVRVLTMLAALLLTQRHVKGFYMKQNPSIT